MARDSFILYKGFWTPIERLSNDQLGRLFRAIYTYQLHGVETAEDDIAIAFGFFLNQFKVDEGKYAEKVAQATRASRSRGRYQPTSEDNGRQRAITGDILNVPVNVNENVNVCVEHTAQAREETHTPHTLDYLRVMFFRNIPKAEQETRKFEGYYESTGWKLQGGDTLQGGERIARAEVWTPENKEARFSRQFLDAWWMVYKSLPEGLKKKALKDRTAVRESDSSVRVLCHPDINKWVHGEGLEATKQAFSAFRKKVNIESYQ